LRQAVSPNGNGNANVNPRSIVCLCGSAGALKEYLAILRRIRPDTNTAFVVISHLSTKHKSHLVHILSGVTKMAVREAQNGMPLRPHEVVVIPPGMELALSDRHLQVLPRSKVFGWSNVADLFLSSLARNYHAKRTAVILSGMGSNGSAALHELKQSGGTILVQRQFGLRLREFSADRILPR